MNAQNASTGTIDLTHDSASSSGSLPALAREVSLGGETGPKFSIATLVTKAELYQVLVDSFVAGNFTSETCEYLFIDNRRSNGFDGYSGLHRLITQARGEYVILCHQDIRLLEQRYDDLLKCIAELNTIDPNWALIGNAGRTRDNKAAICISDRYGDNQRSGHYPQPVVTLDENFIVLKRSACLAPSVDLRGFHLYGADLCLQAAMRGMTSYVVDFMLRHDTGVLRIDDSYYDCLEALEDKYARLMRTRTLSTTCRSAELTGSPLVLAWRRLLRLRKKNSSLKKHRRG